MESECMTFLVESLSSGAVSVDGATGSLAMAAVHSPRCIGHFTSFKTHSTASYNSTLPPSFLHLHIRRHSSPMASSSDAAEVPATGNSETASDVLVQYVVLRRDLIDTWPLGSVVTQGCHASVAAIWSHKDDPHTIDYCSPTNLDSMHKANTLCCLISPVFDLYVMAVNYTLLN